MLDSNLPVFISVAESGSFSQAALRLGKSPQAVFKQITTYEEKLGVKLFDRSSTGMRLTPAGISVYKDAKFLLSFSKESIKRAKEIEKNEGNLVRVALSPLTPTKFLGQVWPIASKQYPDLRIQLVPFENEKNIVWNMLSHLGSDGQVDIVVATYDEDFLERRNCTALKLRDLQLSICMSSTHKLAQKEKISIEDLVEATRRREGGGKLLLRSDDWMRGYDNVKEIFTHDERIEKEFYDFLTMDILNRCGNSNYFLLATESWIFSHPLIKAVPLDINATLPFGAIHSKKPSEPVKKFLRIVDFVNLEYKNFQL